MSPAKLLSTTRIISLGTSYLQLRAKTACVPKVSRRARMPDNQMGNEKRRRPANDTSL